MKTLFTREHSKVLSFTLLAIVISCTVLYSVHQHLIYQPWRLDPPHRPLQHELSTIDVKRILSPQDHQSRKPTTLYHYWNVTSQTKALDGFSKAVYHINDEIPGPTIEARSGDILVIEVTNSLPNDEGLSIHWHGMHMRGANEMDGAVSFTQCAIPPGSNFTYEFQIADDQAGTFWYHSHSQEQTGDGLYGGLIVHEPAEIVQESIEHGYDEEVLLMIGDWGHKSVPEWLSEYLFHLSDGREPMPDTILINGMGLFDCSKAAKMYGIPCPDLEERPQPQLAVERQKSYRFRIINVGSLTGITVTMSGSETKVIQLDGGNRIESNTTTDSVGILYPGERVDIIVSWTNCADDFEPYMTIALDRENFAGRNLNLQPTQSFPVVLSSPDPKSNKLGSTFNSTQGLAAFDLSQAQGSLVPTNTFPEKAEQTFVIYTNMMLDALNHEVPAGLLNHTTWKMQRDPDASLLALDRELWDENQFVPWIDPQHGTWIDVVVNNRDQQGHPFHLHGHDFYVVTSCQYPFNLGSYSPFVDATPPCGPYNLENPLKKDTVYVPPRGHAVIRFNADHEGIWMFHCHILWHQAAGMVMAFQSGGSEHGVFSHDPQRRGVSGRFCKA